ncbi:hypothetical protein KY290_001346 [Solanum tuberosum]|uniref:Retrotransposon Copia-like N-terminal domain-containing protein n=1 Tax=Solanum tuberosum TaxID=4113 RepID=A0ABQ7WLY7_SOLTU|nr:hypothetical protein KY290_001346 [Solanum tuberosum]
MGKSDASNSTPIIIQSEYSSFNAGIILNETNYDTWSQIIEMHIAEKEKLSFVCGSTQPPTEKDEGYEKWYTDNQKVKRWLLMSMSPKIMKRYICLPTAQEIWKALSTAFYDGTDELQIRGEILRKDPVPELEECYSMVRREFVRHATVNGDLEKSEAATIVNRMRSKGINKSTYKCTHCDQSGHTKDRCFEIVGYPEWWDHNCDSRRRNASKSSTAAIVETNAKEDVTGQSTTLVATRGKNGKALNSSALVSNSTWIIDSGATNCHDPGAPLSRNRRTRPRRGLIQAS